MEKEKKKNEKKKKKITIINNNRRLPKKMEKSEKRKSEFLRLVKFANEKIHEDKMKNGMWRNKNENSDVKYRKYCKENNAIGTQGGWKNKLYSVGKSMLQRKIESGEIEIKEEKKKTPKIKTIEAVILYDKETNEYDAYKAEVEKYEEEIIIKIPCGRRKIRINARKEEIENEELVKIALQNRASIYTI